MTKINLTPIIFGENAIKKLPENIKNYKKALLITGKSSIKHNGLYDQLVSELKTAGIKLVEFWGIKPNPTNKQINEAAKLGKNEEVDLIIAAGGGSAIDASKVIAEMITNHEIEESWDIITGKSVPKNNPIDIVAIITLAGTASENNGNTVVTNEELNLKSGWKTRKPVLAIEDASYTKSLSSWQTSAGIFDCFSHITEQWFFMKESFDWTDNYNIGLIKTLIANATKVMKNPENLKARENILFTSSMALNGLSSFNQKGGDWGVHKIAHSLAGIFDTTHGATLALVTPHYWIYMANKYPDFKKRATYLGKEIWNVSNFEETIFALQNFINELKLPTKFSDFKEMGSMSENELERAAASSKTTSYLSIEDIKAILNKISR